MDYDDYMTSESMRKRFPNQFEMVNYAIELTRNRIREGRDLYDSENPVTIVLDEIVEERDRLNDVVTKSKG
jgi:DNA-directed RNA polymerase subunit omega